MSFRRYRSPGSSLLETVIAFFVIAGGLAVIAGIYATTMGTQADDIEASVIVTLAESRLAELRASSTTQSGYQSLSGETGVTASTDPPGYQVQTIVSPETIPYPCAGLRTIDYGTSFQKVVVRVTAAGGRDIALTSIVGEPRREAGTVTFTTEPPAGTTLAVDGNTDFTASLLANDGSPIDDVQFRFYIDFGRGYGRLEEQPDGVTVKFWNQVVNLAPPNLYTGNEVRIVARTYYAGQEYRGVSGVLNLATP